MKPHIVITLKSLIKKILILFLAVGIIYSVIANRQSVGKYLGPLAVKSLALYMGQGDGDYTYSSVTASKSIEETETKSEEKTEDENEEKEQKTTAKTTEAVKAADIKIDENKKKNITTRKIDNSGASTHFGNLYAKNLTKEHSLSLEEELNKEPDIELEDTDEPQVLIMHTHTTECYMPYDLGFYSTDWATRSDDSSLNMAAVGAVITDCLNDAGIKTVHSDKIHDHNYSAAYDLSCETVEEYLEKYPSIKVVLDIHRDAITEEDGTKLKPTVEIDGKNAAQLLIISGCEEGDVTDYPDWELNLRFAVRLQKQLADDYPGLARPMHFAIKKYNQHLTHGSLLIEVGSEANTLEEAKYSATLLSKSLVKVLG